MVSLDWSENKQLRHPVRKAETYPTLTLQAGQCASSTVPQEPPAPAMWPSQRHSLFESVTKQLLHGDDLVALTASAPSFNEFRARACNMDTSASHTALFRQRTIDSEDSGLGDW